MAKTPTEYQSCGLDCGTMNIISARKTNEGVETRRVRDCFLELPIESKKMLKLGKVSYVERGGELVILGDPAMDVANIMGQTVRRPLAAGLVSTSDMDAMDILGLLIKSVLGEPLVQNEHCYFSVPAAPVDRPNQDVIYHRGVLEKIIRGCGYTPTAGNEAMAIIFAETAKDDFSGIACSFGSGMTNCALALNTIEGLTFATSRGGDWIDNGAANSIGSTASRICAIKEKGIDLNNPEGREQDAIVFYYKSLIEYTIDQIALQFQMVKGKFALPKPIPIIVSGGTSKPVGFLEMFTSLFERKRKKFPIEISEIRAATDPLNAVAQGLLIQALQENEEFYG